MTLPGAEAEAQRHVEGAALDVDVASARYLLALVESTCRGHRAAARTSFLLEEIVANLDHGPGTGSP